MPRQHAAQYGISFEGLASGNEVYEGFALTADPETTFLLVVHLTEGG